MRLDLAASRAFGLSRRAARDAVRSGRVDVAGEPQDEPGLDIATDAKITYHPNRPARHRVRSRLVVLHEDADVLIVDKPAGLLTVPTAERESDTLLSRSLDYLQHRYRRRPYLGVVHRLDKDTSGAVAFARNRETLHALQDLFRIHDIEREYLAIVEGSPPESGVLDADLVRDAGLGRRGVARRGESGRRAVTRFRVVERLPGGALVSVRLETGRTHQIRIHFADAGTPVVGDRVYGRRERDAADRPGAGAAAAAPRQMLHARALGFVHPGTGDQVRVQAAPPPDFEEALRALRAGKARSPREQKQNAPPKRGVEKRDRKRPARPGR